MNHNIEEHLGELADVCSVCGIKLDPETMVTTEYLGKVLNFCTDAHLKEYLADPDKYSVYPEDEEAEG